jgi:hypothetical protein
MSAPHEGERLACAAALGRVLSSAKLGFTDLAEWMTSPAAIATRPPRHTSKHGVRRHAVSNATIAALTDIICGDLSECASEREIEISQSLLDQAQRLGGLTERQLDLAADIVGKVRSRSDGAAR